MRKHSRLIFIGLLGVLVLVIMGAVVITTAPSDALAAGRPLMPTPSIPPYIYGTPYSIPSLPGLYVTVTLQNHRAFVIPAPPYDPNWSEPWGSFQSYADWANRFRSQNRGNNPTMRDEIDFWVSQAMGGALDDLQAAAAQAGESANPQNHPAQPQGATQ